MPHELAADEIEGIVAAWREAARRAGEAGFDSIEIHGAHGYLLHEFLSPLCNFRRDEYGGALENRARLHLRVVRAVREVWPAERPLLLRVSASDWTLGGTTPEEIVTLAPSLHGGGSRSDRLLFRRGRACASHPSLRPDPDSRSTLAEQIRREGGIATAAVGMITEPEQADRIIREGRPISSRWGASCCAIRTGRCAPRPRSGPMSQWPRAYERGRW